MGSVTGFCRSVFADVRYALRGLRNAPGYTATVVLTLALGLGAVTALLAIVDSVLLRPVALPEPKQLVMVAREVRGERNYSLGYRQIDALDRETRSFSAVSGYNSLPRPVGAADGARIAVVMRVTPNFFRMVGVRARLGRLLNDADGSAPVAVVSSVFWRERLHADPGAVGSLIRVAGRAMTVVGVAPAGFHFPQNLDGPSGYVPVHLNAKGEDEDQMDSAWVVGRLRPGVKVQQALAEADSVYAHADRGPAADRGRLLLQSYASFLTGDVQPALFALLGGAGILLLIACGNAANLQIARATGRMAEMQVRSALGASAGRLLQQMVTESAVVSLLGAGLGALLAYGVVRGVRVAYGQQFARFDELAVRPGVFLACAVLALLAGALAAAAPALGVRRHTTITGTTTARATRRSRIPGALVALQLALTCVLLVVTGLFVRTFRALQEVKLGFDPHGVTSVVLMPENPNQSAQMTRQTDTRLLERFAALPGVASATIQSSIPFSNFSVTLNGTTEVDGRAYKDGDTANYSLVSNNFVQASGMHLLRGRGFLPQDDASGALVCLVNEAFVQKFLRQRNPLGATLRAHRNPGDKDEDLVWQGGMTVVGVLENELQGALGAPFAPMVYMDYRQVPSTSVVMPVFNLVSEFAVRSTLPQTTVENELRAAMRQVAPEMAEMNMAAMEEAMAQSLTERRLALRLVSSFGAMALLLAAIGIYGVLAYAVAQRRREIGIRMALGSSRAGATQLVLRQAAVMVSCGVVLGGAAAWPAGVAVKRFLFGVRALDPATLGAVATGLLLVCAMAAAVPAWRATRVDPMEALRTE